MAVPVSSNARSRRNGTEPLMGVEVPLASIVANAVIFGLVVCHYAEAQGGAGCYFTMCVQDNNASCRWSWVAPASSVAMNDEFDGQSHVLNRVQPHDGTGWTAGIAR